MKIKTDREKIEEIRLFSKSNMPKLPYHNFEHGVYVAANAISLGYMEGLTQKEVNILETSGYTHDLVVVPGRTDNEEKSLELSEPELRRIGYNPDEIAMNSVLTMATKLPTKPTILIEKVICDSDIWNIGGDEFWSSTDLVRREYGINDLERWYTQVQGFLDKQKFYTSAGQTIRNSGLDKNRRLVESLLRDFSKARGNNQGDILDLHLTRHGLRQAA